MPASVLDCRLNITLTTFSSNPYDAADTISGNKHVKSFIYILKNNLVCYKVIQIKFLQKQFIQ